MVQTDRDQIDPRTFHELKSFVGFGPEDEAALRALAPVAAPRLREIADEFYARIDGFLEARKVIAGPEMLTTLKRTLCEWMESLLTGPWDDRYFERRARIGRVHVHIGLAQRFMFTSMNVIRLELVALAEEHHARDVAQRLRAIKALSRILDIELAIVMETYREAYVDRVRELERLEIDTLTRRLALSEARYEEIVEKGQALIVTADASGRIVLFNGRCQALTGLSRAKATSMTLDEVFGVSLREPQAAVLAGQTVAPVETPIDAVGGATRWVRWELTTIPGPQGPLLCAIGIDTTEERALAARSRRSERLASLGMMAAGLAHEIRNPLNAADLQLMLVRRRLARMPVGDAAASEAAELAASEMKRLAALVEEFLQFARPQPLRTGHVNLRASAQAVLALLQPELASAGASLELAPGGPVHAEVDDERMKQVLINLVRNAVEATGGGGTVRLAIEEAGGQAILEVADDGPGVPRDAPIFEPFFTTKESGTGLGLAIVHRIVSDHGGRVDVERRGDFTVFSVALPRTGA